MAHSSLAHKVVGYFSYSTIGNVFCDGDACLISGTEELMSSYINKMISDHKSHDVIKKTRFGEIMRGLEQGAAYAFDKEAYLRFLSLAQKYGLSDLPDPEQFFLESSPTGLHFIRIQSGGDR